MKTTSHRQQTLDQIANTRDVISQADAEGRALRGEFGVDRQLVALSEQYNRLRAAGELDEAAAIKAQAYAIYNAARER